MSSQQFLVKAHFLQTLILMKMSANLQGLCACNMDKALQLRELSHNARKASLHHSFPCSSGHRSAMTSNPLLPGDIPWRPALTLSRRGFPWPSSWQTPAVMKGGKLVQGQGLSSLIIPIELQRQMLRAFDISFILVFCSFVQLSLYRSAAGVLTITSCFPEFNFRKVV